MIKPFTPANQYPVHLTRQPVVSALIGLIALLLAFGIIVRPAAAQISYAQQV